MYCETSGLSSTDHSVTRLLTYSLGVRDDRQVFAGADWQVLQRRVIWHGWLWAVMVCT